MRKLIDRVQKILLAPKAEWPVIAAEPATQGSIFTGYIIFLASIGPIASFIRSTLIGYSVPFAGTFRVDFMDGLIGAILSYALALAAVWVFAQIINALAPTFGSQKDPVQALKAAAYAMTAAWIAGVANIIPFLGMIVMIAGAAYSVYLLYLGLPATMKTPADKAVGYTAVSCVIAVAIYWVAALIVGLVIGGSMMMGGRWGAAIVDERGSFEEGSPLGKLEDWAKNVEEAGKRVEASEDAKGVPSSAAIGALLGAVTGSDTSVQALSTEEIKALIPETLAGLPRTALTSERNGAMGVQVSEANAVYGDGQGRSLRLSLNDTGGAQGLVQLAAWAGVEQERSWDGGYERDYRQDGRMLHERWDNNSGSGEFGVVVGGRFAVHVAGQAANIDELKSALASGVDLAKLESIAAAGKSGG
jgi:hypothetical protein